MLLHDILPSPPTNTLTQTSASVSSRTSASPESPANDYRMPPRIAIQNIIDRPTIFEPKNIKCQPVGRQLPGTIGSTGLSRTAQPKPVKTAARTNSSAAAHASHAATPSLLADLKRRAPIPPDAGQSIQPDTIGCRTECPKCRNGEHAQTRERPPSTRKTWPVV